MFFSILACASVVEHVGCEMQLEIVQHIVASKSKFSVLVDESTSVSHVQSMVVYVPTIFDLEACVYFLGLLPVALSLQKVYRPRYWEFFYFVGLTNEIMCRSFFVGFCNDGARTGQHNGLAALLTRKFPLLKSFHSITHILELAVKNAFDMLNSVSHFHDLAEGLYKIYSMFQESAGN